MEERANESIRARWRKTKNKPEPEREGLEVTITVEDREEERDVVLEEENMPELLTEEEFGEIEAEYGEERVASADEGGGGSVTRKGSVECGG